jgi:hypothetical protein
MLHIWHLPDSSLDRHFLVAQPSASAPATEAGDRDGVGSTTATAPAAIVSTSMNRPCTAYDMKVVREVGGAVLRGHEHGAEAGGAVCGRI